MVGTERNTRVEEFLDELDKRGHVSQDFQRLVDAGCDPQRLKAYLWKLSRLSPQKTKRRFQAKHLKKLETIASKLEDIASELGPFYELLFHEGYLTPRQSGRSSWEKPTGIPRALREAASQLRECSTSARSLSKNKRNRASFPPDLNPRFATGMRSLLLGDTRNAYEFIPSIIDYVTGATRRQHYRESATLIGAALGKEAFTAEGLKRICAHRKGIAGKR